MPRLKLTKNELRLQQNKLKQLNRYLPTLHLKKALIQTQVTEAKNDIQRLEDDLKEKLLTTQTFAGLFADNLAIDISPFITIKSIKKHIENIAGADVPVFDSVSFENLSYDLFETPVWLESAIYSLQKVAAIRGKIVIANERKEALEKELRQISIRVNLFEKVLIPRCENNVKRIKIFMGDMTLQAIGQAKIAKSKIEKALQRGETT